MTPEEIIDTTFKEIDMLEQVLADYRETIESAEYRICNLFGINREDIESVFDYRNRSWELSPHNIFIFFPPEDESDSLEAYNLWVVFDEGIRKELGNIVAFGVRHKICEKRYTSIAIVEKDMELP